MYTITYDNKNGQSVSFSDNPSVQALNLSGFGDVGADIQLQKSPYQDGSTYIDSLLTERDLSIEFLIYGTNYEEVSETRRKISQTFSPKTRGTVSVNIAGVVYEIDVVPEHAPTFPTGDSNQGSRYQRGVIDLIAPNPFWKSPVVEEAPTFEALFEFPFESEFELGIQRDKRTINNDSDSPIPIQVEFYGPATNPIIVNNTTGEFIKVNQTLGENEYMKVDTTRGQKSVHFVGADGVERNVINWIDLDSSFFHLVVGENEIEYSADSDIQGAVVNIYYQKLYVGV